VFFREPVAAIADRELTEASAPADFSTAS